ncbi:iron-containing alcohol dehydrogenase [Paraburkholderia sediminicola]|uniref:iron-containing alcohol dehydrogenase n=1 Tax=Paraburkholderia sediminicola TaxID=458836 RepID=UPI000EB4D009
MSDIALPSHNFYARNYPLKVYAGVDALAALPKELQRLGLSRALVLCGRSVRERTSLIQRVEAIAGDRIAGVYADISEGAPAERVEAAAAMAREIKADALIAVGAGSVIKGARVVAMLLGENRSVSEIATVHSEDKPPVSRRLPAPKVPIFNILTSPTSAQNRGGSAVRYHGAAHHLEFFDPKTRPKAVFWDPEALATAPLSLMRSTSFEIYWWAFMCMGSVATANPLVEASRRQAWKLARGAYRRLHERPDSNTLIDLCAAALLQNRDEEDGGQPWSCQLLARAAYASAVGVFNHYPHVTQSRGYAAFAPAMIRGLGAVVPDVTRSLGEVLGIQVQATDPVLADRVADQLTLDFSELGWPTDLGDCNIPFSDAPKILSFALRNYNANHDRLLDRHADTLLACIERTIAPR